MSMLVIYRDNTEICRLLCPVFLELGHLGLRNVKRTPIVLHHLSCLVFKVAFDKRDIQEIFTLIQTVLIPLISNTSRVILLLVI